MNPKAISKMIRRQLCRDVDPKRSCQQIASRKSNRGNRETSPNIASPGVREDFLSDIGMERAPEKLKTALRRLIASVIDRTIHFSTRGTAMSDHTKERSMMEHPSRRSFLGMSSVALATAALAGLTANAQDKESTHKAEHDNSSS